MGIEEIVGFTAGLFIAISSIPQVLKSWKTKSTGDLSWGWLCTMVAGTSLWVAYGIIVSSLPIIVSNMVSDALILVVCLMKFRYDRKNTVCPQ